jgi:hypothetical protein
VGWLEPCWAEGCRGRRVVGAGSTSCRRHAALAAYQRVRGLVELCPTRRRHHRLHGAAAPRLSHTRRLTELQAVTALASWLEPTCEARRRLPSARTWPERRARTSRTRRASPARAVPGRCRRNPRRRSDLHAAPARPERSGADVGAALFARGAVVVGEARRSYSIASRRGPRSSWSHRASRC